MTAPYRRTDAVDVLGNHERRVSILEANPLPATPVVPAMWPLSYDVLPYLRVYTGMDFDTTWGFGNTTVDSTYAPAGYYTDNFNGSFRDDASFISYFRLGPQGSAWCLNWTVETGPDCAIVETEWATLPESSTGQGYPYDGLGLPPNSTDHTFNWYIPQSGNYVIPNFYAGPTTKANVYQEWNPFRITGVDGTPLTADGVDDGYFSYSDFNGGSGLWALRMRVNGKDAASSNYKARFSSMRLSRISSVSAWEIG